MAARQPLIISDPKILGGKPVIADTRISVELILDRVASGMSIKDILKDYPHLKTNQIQAALSFAKNSVMKKAHRSRVRFQEPNTTFAHEISR